MRIIGLVTIALMLMLTACSTTTVYAPVSEISTIEPLPKNGVYRVRADDTLYSIAWRYGLDYRYLATVNHIARPYHIEAGQIIYLRGAPRHIVPAKVNGIKVKTSPVQPQIVEKEPTAQVTAWHWPASGVLLNAFSASNKGINIGGQLGDSVFATAAGKVVYSGDGLRAYGNLIIIKHNSVFLSAYAYNNKVFVKEGDWVKSGQKIAEMGKASSQQIMLHFEIRRSGKPVNPLSYLSRK